VGSEPALFSSKWTGRAMLTLTLFSEALKEGIL
jgi:hypothetical protein